MDYLAYMRSLGKNGRSAFKLFVKDYLMAINQDYDPDELYALRCSLVHTYAESEALSSAGLDGFQMTHRHPDFHLSKYQPRVIRINCDTFVADVVWAAFGFFSSADRRRVEERSGSLLVVGQDGDAYELQRSYASMHRALSELDSEAPRLENLRSAIAAIYPPTSG